MPGGVLCGAPQGSSRGTWTAASLPLLPGRWGWCISTPACPQPSSHLPNPQLQFPHVEGKLLFASEQGPPCKQPGPAFSYSTLGIRREDCVPPPEPEPWPSPTPSFLCPLPPEPAPAALATRLAVLLQMSARRGPHLSSPSACSFSSPSIDTALSTSPPPHGWLWLSKAILTLSTGHPPLTEVPRRRLVPTSSLSPPGPEL